MTKKDYQAIAAAIFKARTRIQDERITLRPDIQMTGAEQVIAALIEVCKADNPRFEASRFLEACETGKTKGMRQVQG